MASLATPEEKAHGEDATTLLEATQQRERVSQYLNAAKKGDVELLKTLVNGAGGKEEGATALVSCKEATGKTSLHFSAAMGRSKACMYILEIAPKAYAERDEQGNAPLHMACKGGHLGVVELLLKAGADPCEANKSGVCPLHHVDEPKIVEMLCKAGANPNANAKEGGTPLHFAVADGHINVILELIKQGANVEVTDSRGLTPIILAAASGDGECVATLLKDGKADGGAILTGGLTVLHMCAEMEEEEEAVVATNALLNTGSGIKSVNMKSHDGDLPIHLAANVGNEEVVRVLYPHTTELSNTTVQDIINAGKQIMMENNGKNNNNDSINKNKSKTNIEHVHEISGLESIEAFQNITKPASSEENKQLAQDLKNKGNQYTVAKDYKKAIELYSEALNLQGNNEVFWSNRSAAYLQIDGMEQLALRDALVAQKLNPDWLKGHYRVGQAYMKLKKYIDAATAFWSALKLDEKNKQLKKAFDEAVKLGREQHHGPAKN